MESRETIRRVRTRPEVTFGANMGIRQSIKGLVLGHTPPSLLTWCKKRHYLKQLERFGADQEPDLRLVRRLVRTGDTAIDIGAHVGWYTVVLSQLVSDSGRVVSIEPIPETFEILRWCVGHLQLRNVTLFNRAISNIAGVVTMHVPRYETGGANFYQARIRSSEDPGKGLLFQVPVIGLDDLLNRVPFGPIRFVKCDVEGNELAVVEGAQTIICRHRPAWLIEVSSDPDDAASSAGQLFALLGERGYTAYLLEGNRLKKRSTGDMSVNYFFLTAEHLREYFGKDFRAGSFAV
jgi:FkbM family methyltransferase